MADALGLLGIAGYIAAVIGLAAGVTWLTVKLSPNPNTKTPKADD